MEHKLKYPIKTASGKTVSSVSVRKRPLVADVMYVAEHATNPKIEAVWMIARLCGLDVSEIEQMDLEDYNEIYGATLAGKEPSSD